VLVRGSAIDLRATGMAGCRWLCGRDYHTEIENALRGRSAVLEA
jgi:hypothetical protein